MNGIDNSVLRFIQLDQIPIAVMAIVVAIVLNRLGIRFFDRVSERFTKYRLTLKQLASIGRFVVILVAALFAIGSVIQFSNQALLALGGTLAVAFGFAFKDLLASIMAGLILLFDRPFQVGDRITFDGHYGEVVEIGLRSVRLVTLDDNLVSIPNNKFLTDIVASANSGVLHQMCVFHFFIGCNEDFEEAKDIIYDAAASSRYVFLDKPIRVEMKEGPVPEVVRSGSRWTSCSRHTCSMDASRPRSEPT